ncbi:short chain dehydrogenase [Cadophora sp. DSE1049]|nr:short chain dehydrogenase [Cadophora sp. DSE1049]
MAGRNVLIIGANRGLGLGLLKVFKEHGYTVYGTIRPQTRSDASFTDLEDTGATIIDLDYLQEDSIAAAAKAFGGERTLDVLVNCGGIGMDPKSWLDTTAEQMIYKYRVMTVGPFLASKYFLPNLKKSKFGKIVNITSEWASIAADDCGTCASYRVPKTALNSLSVIIVIELKAAKENIAVLCIDPGDVPTKLSHWEGDIKLEDSVRGMYGQIEKPTIEDSGLFVNWAGHKWPY